MKISRAWAMPSKRTFEIKPISELLDRWLEGRGSVVDPFARLSERAHYRNDLNPSAPTPYHMEAADFCLHLQSLGVRADAVLFDPPYSPRQISEAYQSVGRAATRTDTQNGRLYREVKDGLAGLLEESGISVSCGWNTSGFGVGRGFEIEEVLIVCHGGAHNDTLVVVERKV